MMTYNEIMQKAGRIIKKNIFYYQDNDKIYVDKNSFESANLWFDSNIIGTSMTILDLELKENINQSQVYYEVNASYGNEKQQMVYGPFFLKEEPTYNANDKIYSYTYCDFFIKTMINYEAINMIYPCKLQDYYNKLNETLGYTSSVLLINGERILESDIYTGINFTYRDVYTDIAQANGILLYANKFKIKEAILTDENAVTLTDKTLKNTNVDFGEHIGPYNTIVLSRSGDSDNIYIQDDESVELNGNIEFKISDNQLMNDNNRSDYLPGLLEKIKGIEFDTFDVEITGYGGFNPLQKVNFITGDNQYSSYVFSNEMTFTDGFEETLNTPVPNESVTDYSVSDKTDKRINQAYIIVDKQNQKINSLTSQVEEYQEKFSEIEQTVDGITQQVNAMYDFVREVKGNNKVKIEEVQENGILEIHITGEIQQPIVSDETLVSDGTTLKSTNLIFENDESIQRVYLPINYLNVLDDISDEFVWELIYDDELKTYIPKSKIIRRIIITNGEKKIRFQPIEEELESFSINVEIGTYNVYLESFRGLDYSIKYAILNEITDQFATKTNLSSAITQTSTSINQEVNAKIEGVNKEVNAKLELKVNTDELISEINASADIIRINTGRFILRGQNCSINEQGIFSAVGGKFSGNITGGTINIESSNSVIATFTDTLNKKSTKLNGSSIMIDDTELNSSGIRAIDGGYNSVYYADAVEMHYGSSYTRITAIDGVTHSSKEEYKKNIEEKTGCLKLVKNAKIYSYLFKEENNNSKKHIGLVIGNNYNNPEEVLNKAKDGIELYNMVGILWQAVRELTEKVEKLERNNKDV